MEGAYAEKAPAVEKLAKVAEESAQYVKLPPAKLMQKIKQLEHKMYKHARDLEFEEAARLRDEIEKIRALGLELPETKVG